MARVWDCWNNPKHITNWYQASSDWHAPKASSDFVVGGSFSTTMAAKDGSMSFDFGGVFTAIIEHTLVAYDLEDGRKVEIQFEETAKGVSIVESFDPESENTHELQQSGWQAILDSFKTYVEGLAQKA